MFLMGLLELRYSLHISNAKSSLIPFLSFPESQGYVSFDLVPFSGKPPTASRRKMEPKRRRPNFQQSFVQNPTRIFLSQKLRSEKQANLFSNPMLSCPLSLFVWKRIQKQSGKWSSPCFFLLKSHVIIFY